MLSQSLFLDKFLRTVVRPPDETGHFAAWGLDFGAFREPQVTVLSSHSEIPARAPFQDEMFVWFGAPMPGAAHVPHDAAFPLLVNSRVLDDGEVGKAFSFIRHEI